MNKIRKETIEEEFKTYWVPIIFDEESGKLNLEQLKKELFDYSMLLEFVPKVYSEVTNGLVSKPNTLPEQVIDLFNDHVNELADEAVKEKTQDTIQALEGLRQKFKKRSERDTQNDHFTDGKNGYILGLQEGYKASGRELDQIIKDLKP